MEQEAGPLLVDTQSTKRKRAESLDERSTEPHEKKRSTVVSEPGQIMVNGPKFSNLETELHDLIFEELEIKDVLSLSLTNRYFWSVGRRHIQTYAEFSPVEFAGLDSFSAPCSASLLTEFWLPEPVHPGERFPSARACGSNEE